MKKYFLFDNEPITGQMYFGRYLVGTLLFFLGVGIWIIAASSFKRSGAFAWSKEARVISAIIIPLTPLSGIAFQETGNLNLFDFFAIIAVIMHLVFIFKTGNKANT